MKQFLRVSILIFAAITSIEALMAQQKDVAQNEATTLPSVWSLNDCINYAIENNIQIKQSKNDYLSGIESTKAAEAAKLPSLSGSLSQGFTNNPSSNAISNNNYTGSYSLDASFALYSGGRINKSIEQNKVGNEMDMLMVEENENNITISIIQAYMQCLYSSESVNVANQNLEISLAQMERGKALLESGSISKVDFAQLEGQYASDKYQVVVANNNLDNNTLTLKQLLELDIREDITLDEPNINDQSVLRVVESKYDIYNAALEAMPEIKWSQLNLESKDLAEDIARSGYMPTVSVIAGVGTNHITSSSSSVAISSQMGNNFNENVGLKVSVPIFNNRSTKTAVNQAKIAKENSTLEAMNIEKNLLSSVESTYLNATSSQTQYISATEQIKYFEESYSLVLEQFGVGLKNTVDLLTAQNNYFNAKIEAIQAKYMAVMNLEILNIYQGKEISREL